MLHFGQCAVRRARTASNLLIQFARRRSFNIKVGLLEDLASRGLIVDITRPDKLEKHLNDERQTVYAGIDPTAPSLHVGHLIPLIVLLHFQIRGHFVLSLVGGATGLVGDPTGRSEERQPADPAKIKYNVTKLQLLTEKFFESAALYAKARLQPSGKHVHEPRLLDNTEWLQGLKLLDFLRTGGVHVRLGTMLARESVRSRMESHHGISFTEFTYQLLQAYDFFWLHKNLNCSIQIGGSDQWGNILAGLEMINRENMGPLPGPEIVREKGFGMTTPLLTNIHGKKIGKTAGNAIWLDEGMTSAFDFYQFFLQTPDGYVEQCLRMLTLLSISHIDDVIIGHKANPEMRIAQRLLANEVTELVHGKQGLKKAFTTTKIIFGSDYQTLTASDVIAAFANDPRLVYCDKTTIFNQTLVQLAAAYELVSSKSEAMRLIQAKGLYLNNKPVQFERYKLTRTDLIDDKVAILRTGKSKHLILAVS